MWIAAPLLIVSMAFVYRLERIRVGRAFIAIREDELAADAMGVNPTRYKVLAFTLSAVLAGVAGATQRALLQHVELATGDIRPGREPHGLRPHRRVPHLPGAGGGRPRAHRPPRGAPLGWQISEGCLAGSPSSSATGGSSSTALLIAVGSVFFPHGLITPGLLIRRPPPARREPWHGAPDLGDAGGRRQIRRVPLAVEAVTCRFGGLIAVNEVSFDVREGRDLRAHRAQWRRQDHALQPHHGSHASHGRAASLPGPRHHRPAASSGRRARVSHGRSRTSGSSAISPPSTTS